MVDILSELNGNWDYVAFVASDQVLCLSEPARRELAALLDAAAAQDSDVIFFDGPPALSLCRLRFFLSSAQLPRKDGVMALASEEGTLDGLGWLDAEVRKFDVSSFSQKTHLPHMGWNDVSPVQKGCLFRNIGDEPRFYFLHSY